MPKPKADDGAHNLTGDEEQALFIHHLSKLRQQDKKVAAAKTALDAERAVLNDFFHLAKVDKFSRKELRAILDDSLAQRRDLVAEEERRAKLRLWAGLPAGTQADLFESMPEEVRDETFYRGAGYAAGLRGDEAIVPEEVPSRFVQAWMAGRMEGQERLSWGLAKSAKILEPKEPEPAVDDSDEDDGAVDIDIEAEARKLKAKGFLEHSPDLTPAA